MHVARRLWQVSILHPQSAQHPKLSSITLEHNHPIDKAEVEAKLAQKAWQAAKYQFLGQCHVM